MKDLVNKTQSDSDSFKSAPKYTPVRRLDETKAAREPILRWKKETIIAAE